MKRLHPLVIRLKSRRKELGYTQKALAEHMGYSHNTIKQWEAGGNVPAFHSLIDWTDALGMRLMVYDPGTQRPELVRDNGWTPSN